MLNVEQRNRRGQAGGGVVTAYPDGHVAYIGVLRALHEDKRRVSGVLDHHLVCYLTGSCDQTKRTR